MVAGIAACRLLILPAVGALLVLGALQLGFSPPDPIFLLVMLIHHTAPSAVNVHTMASVLRNHEREVSVVLFYQYIASIVTLPPFLMAFLYLSMRTFGDVSR